MIAAWLVASGVLMLAGLHPVTSVVVAAVAVIVPKLLAARTVDVQIVGGRVRRWP